MIRKSANLEDMLAFADALRRAAKSAIRATEASAPRDVEIDSWDVEERNAISASLDELLIAHGEVDLIIDENIRIEDNSLMNKRLFKEDEVKTIREEAITEAFAAASEIHAAAALGISHEDFLKLKAEYADGKMEALFKADYQARMRKLGKNPKPASLEDARKKFDKAFGRR